MMGKELSILLTANAIGQGDVYPVRVNAVENINRLKASLHAYGNAVLLNHIFQKPTSAAIKPKLLAEGVLRGHLPAITPEFLAPNLLDCVRVGNQNITVNEGYTARAVSKVLEDDVYRVLFGVDFCNIGINVRPYLRLADISGDSNGLLGGTGGVARFGKGSPDEIDPKAGKPDASKAGDSHNLRPEGHSLLRVKIAFGSAMVVSGYYLYGYAFKKGRRVSVEAGLPYAILGVFNVIFGALIAAHAYFSLLAR